jgi:hypothetical protein
MTGVSILETVSVITETTAVFSYAFAFASGCIGLIIGMSTCLAIAIKKDKDLSKPFVGLFCMLVAVIVGYLGGWLGADRVPVQEETRYRVKLTEDLDYKEFSAKYEVIDFNNGVYTIRERD